MNRVLSILWRSERYCSPLAGRRTASLTASAEELAPNEVLEFAALYSANCAGCHGENGRGGAAIALADPVYLPSPMIARFAKSSPMAYAEPPCRHSPRAPADC